MSRYLYETDRWRVVVGWDNPMHTYFCIVYDLDVMQRIESLEDQLLGTLAGSIEHSRILDHILSATDEERIKLWRGNSFSEIETIEALESRLRAFGIKNPIPLDIRLRIAEDRRRAPEPTPLQKKFRSIVEGVVRGDKQ